MKNLVEIVCERDERGLEVWRGMRQIVGLNFFEV